MVLLLTKQDLESILDMKSVIQAVELGYKERALGTAELPPRAWVSAPKHSGWLGAMLAYLGGIDALGMKITSTYPNNPKVGYPTVGGTILLADSKTGFPISIMDGIYITAVRTGAAAAVATKYLARKNASKAAIIGDGVIGRSTLTAIAEVRKLESVTIYDILPDVAKKYVEEMEARLRIPITSCENPDIAVRNADIIVTSTTSLNPVFHGEQILPGVHINSMGWISPESRELDNETITKAHKIVLDFWDDAIEAAEIKGPIKEGLISKDSIYAEIGEIVCANKAGRTSDKEVTLFKSVGVAAIDVSTAKVAYDLAKKKSVGKEITL
jgi:alanine dehydrogenase